MTTKKQTNKELTVEGKKTIQLKSTPEVARGVYSNVALIKHTDNEFVFDFIFSDSNEGHLVSRVVTNPTHAKMFLKALEENVQKYEKKFIKQ
jgi:hypothetical protein